MIVPDRIKKTIDPYRIHVIGTPGCDLQTPVPPGNLR